MKWSTHYTGGTLCGLAASAAFGLPVEGAAALTAGARAASIAPGVTDKFKASAGKAAAGEESGPTTVTTGRSGGYE